MGATFNTITRSITLTPKQLRDAFADEQARDRHENGWDYSGGFGQADGLEIVARPPFLTLAEAEEWLSTITEKWGPAKACVAHHGDETFWVVCAWCAE